MGGTSVGYVCEGTRVFEVDIHSGIGQGFSFPRSSETRTGLN